MFSRPKFETVTRHRRKFRVEPELLEIAFGFHETSNIHRRFTELCIGTLILFNLTVTILMEVLVNVLATKSEKNFLLPIRHK